MTSKKKQALRTKNVDNRLMFHACQTAARSGRQQITRRNRERAERRFRERQEREQFNEDMRKELRGRQ